MRIVLAASVGSVMTTNHMLDSLTTMQYTVVVLIITKLILTL